MVRSISARLWVPLSRQAPCGDHRGSVPKMVEPEFSAGMGVSLSQSQEAEGLAMALRLCSICCRYDLKGLSYQPLQLKQPDENHMLR